MISQSKVRNFCVIAHIDHGKSTLADRMLEITKTVESRKMREQYLDMMDLERERGITIKLQPVRMNWQDYILNLIDTPGHVDFSYEVSRSLAAVEGAVLLVDATQGIQAQTLSHLEIAKKENLKIIPVVNKIDMAAAEPTKTAEEIKQVLGCEESEIIFASSKTGEGVEKILEAIIERIPAPKGLEDGKLRALIFDSYFDTHQGVVAYIRVVDGRISSREKVSLQGTGVEFEVHDLGVFKPQLISAEELGAGEIGYLVTGLKDIKEVKIGDTVFPYSTKKIKITPLPGYQIPKPKVFASFFCEDSSEFEKLRDACGKITLSDSSLEFKPTSSPLLGLGMEGGFLGGLHLDIVAERLEREYNLSLIISQPSVEYKVIVSGKEREIKNPNDLPETFEKIYEPYALLEIITPNNYLGKIMEMVTSFRASYVTTEVLSEERSILKYEIPLSELFGNFHDCLKSASSGFASLNYQVTGFREACLSKLEFLVAFDKIPPFSMIVAKEKLEEVARAKVERLKKIIPRQNFEVRIQATTGGGKVIAAEKIPAFRKDVIAKLYGGDRTRKDKLLKKQAKGKKKMRRLGRVEVPKDVFLKFLK